MYIEPKTARGIVCAFLTASSKRKEKALLKKRTVKKRDKLMVVIDDPRHDEIDKFLKRELMHHLSEWIMTSHDGPYNYEVEDAAFRIAGTGSLGQKRYVFLLKSLSEKDKYLLVDMKQALPSSLAPYIKPKAA